LTINSVKQYHFLYISRLLCSHFIRLFKSLNNWFQFVAFNNYHHTWQIGPYKYRAIHATTISLCNAIIKFANGITLAFLSVGMVHSGEWYWMRFKFTKGKFILKDKNNRLHYFYNSNLAARFILQNKLEVLAVGNIITRHNTRITCLFWKCVWNDYHMCDSIMILHVALFWFHLRISKFYTRKSPTFHQCELVIITVKVVSADFYFWTVLLLFCCSELVLFWYSLVSTTYFQGVRLLALSQS